MKSIRQHIQEEIKKVLKIEFRNLSRKKTFINEARVQGKTIVNVDIQPEYESGISFNLYEWINFLNKSAKKNHIVFLYNGEDTLGMISKSDYGYWLLENGLEEDVLDSARFYDKGYAFFRYCIDHGIDDAQIVNLIKYMIHNNINDSRDIDMDMWKDFVSQYGSEDIKNLMECASDMINIPDLMDELREYNNIVLTGGGVNECLKEVELGLMALDKPYSVLKQFTY